MLPRFPARPRAHPLAICALPAFVLAVAAALLLLLPGGAGSTPEQRTITIAAASSYRHDDSDNRLLAQYETADRCTGDGTFHAWTEIRWGGGNSTGWNGLRTHPKGPHNHDAIDVHIVGSALQTDVSATLALRWTCNGGAAIQGGRETFTVEVTGELPANLAPESIYYGIRLSDGPHPDNAHDDDLDALALGVAKAQCLGLRQHGVYPHWDSERTAPPLAPGPARQLDAVLETHRQHCCIASGNTVTEDQCFEPTLPAPAPAPQSDDASDAGE